MSHVYLSFLDHGGNIVYEYTAFTDTYIGCMKHAYLEYYGDRLCQRMVSLDYPFCLSLHIVAGGTHWDFVRVVID